MQNSITLTPAALQHLQENLAQSPAGTLGVRVGLRDAGCSGYAYTIDFTKEVTDTDQVFDNDGVKIVVANDYFKALKGTVIDLVQEGVNSILEFKNPNVVHECGCGESFQLKESEE
jgi:iron-sulfur cluster assembly accessory protein